MHGCAGQQQILSSGWGTAMGTAGIPGVVLGAPMCWIVRMSPQSVSTQIRGRGTVPSPGTAQGWLFCGSGGQDWTAPPAWAVCPPACECPIQGCAKCIGSGTLVDSWDPSSGQGDCRAGAGFTPAGGLGALGGGMSREEGEQGPMATSWERGSRAGLPVKWGGGSGTAPKIHAMQPKVAAPQCQHNTSGQTKGPHSTCPLVGAHCSPEPAPICAGGCSPSLELPLQLEAGEGNKIPGLTAQQNPALAGMEEPR